MLGWHGFTIVLEHHSDLVAVARMLPIDPRDLAALTHTPSPMGFLQTLLERPDHETAMLVLPVGYPAEDAKVPDLARKALESISVFLE